MFNESVENGSASAFEGAGSAVNEFGAGVFDAPESTFVNRAENRSYNPNAAHNSANNSPHNSPHNSANNFNSDFADKNVSGSDLSETAGIGRFGHRFEPVTREDVVNFYKNRNLASQNRAENAAVPNPAYLKSVVSSRIAPDNKNKNLPEKSGPRGAKFSQIQNCFDGINSPNMPMNSAFLASPAETNFSSHPPKNPCSLENSGGQWVFASSNPQNIYGAEGLERSAGRFSPVNFANQNIYNSPNACGAGGLPNFGHSVESAFALLDNPNFRQHFAQILTGTAGTRFSPFSPDVYQSAGLNAATGVQPCYGGVSDGMAQQMANPNFNQNFNNNTQVYNQAETQLSPAFSGYDIDGAKASRASGECLQNTQPVKCTPDEAFARLEAKEPGYFGATAARVALKDYLNANCAHLNPDELDKILSLAQMLESQAVEAFRAQNAREKSLAASNRAAIDKLGTDSGSGKRSQTALGKIFTRDEIGEMSLREYKQNEAEIFAQYRKGLIR